MSYTGTELQEYMDDNGLNELLYEHQKDVIEWMFKRSYDRKGSLLAHSMGLGKTLDICILLQISLPRIALIICPTSCVYSQWVRNLLTYSFYFKVYVLKSNKLRQVIFDDESNIIKSRELPLSVLNENPNFNKVVVSNYHAIVPHPAVQRRSVDMSGNEYEMDRPIDVYDPEITPLNEIVWDMVVVDEIHAIRNGVNTRNDPNDTRKKMLRYYRLSRLRMTPIYGVRIGLTGTPIQNRISDIVSIYTFLGATFTKKCTPKEIKDANKEYMHRITADDLHPILRSKINFPEVDFVEIVKNVVYETQSEEDVYRIVAGALNGQYIPGGENNPYSQVVYDENPLVRTCRECYLSADINMFIDIHNKAYKNIGIILPLWRGTESKMKMIVRDIYEFSLENKSLICFIHYHSEKFAVINKIEEYSQQFGLESRFGYVYFYIDGTVTPEERDFVLKETKRLQILGKRVICFATVQSSAEGLNMQHFDTVLFTTSDWNPANELQAIARVHRIGQKNLVKVYRYIHDCVTLKHIDVHKLNIQSAKTAKSNEFVEECENAAHSWPIRDLEGFPGEKSVILRDKNPQMNPDEFDDPVFKKLAKTQNALNEKRKKEQKRFEQEDVNELVESLYNTGINDNSVNIRRAESKSSSYEIRAETKNNSRKKSNNVGSKANATPSIEEIRNARIANFKPDSK